MLRKLGGEFGVQLSKNTAVGSLIMGSTKLAERGTQAKKSMLSACLLKLVLSQSHHLSSTLVTSNEMTTWES